MATIEEIKILLEQAQCKLALLQQLEQALSQCAEIEQHLGLVGAHPTTTAEIETQTETPVEPEQTQTTPAPTPTTEPPRPPSSSTKGLDWNTFQVEQKRLFKERGEPYEAEVVKNLYQQKKNEIKLVQASPQTQVDQLIRQTDELLL